MKLFSALFISLTLMGSGAFACTQPDKTVATVTPPFCRDGWLYVAIVFCNGTRDIVPLMSYKLQEECLRATGNGGKN